MSAYTKEYVKQQLKKFKRQKEHLKNIQATIDQRRQLTKFYDREINFWQGWVNTFKKIEQNKANQITVNYENVN